MANIDVLIAVASEVNPVTDPFLIDRVTAFAEHIGCEVVICINKADAGHQGRLRDIYATTGYRVIETSAVTGEGIDELRECMRGKVCAFSGNSGVGKSSLLNALEPGLKLETGDVSEKLGRFPEFEPYIGHCRFDDCAHLKEPGCAVREAMDEGKINPSRHESYARLYEISAKYREWEK